MSMASTPTSVDAVDDVMSSDRPEGGTVGGTGSGIWNE